MLRAGGRSFFETSWIPRSSSVPSERGSRAPTRMRVRFLLVPVNAWHRLAAQRTSYPSIHGCARLPLAVFELPHRWRAIP